MSAPTNAQIFGRKLHDLLSDKGVTQSKLASTIWGTTTDTRGVTVARNRNRISHYVSGRVLPNAETRAAIAKALGVELSELVQGIDLTPPGIADAALSQNELTVTPVPGEPGLVILRLTQRLPRELAGQIMALVMAAPGE